MTTSKQNGSNADNTLASVDISCNIINSLRELGSAGVTELSNKLGYSKSTIHNHLNTLRENELVVKSGTRYRLSLRFLNVAEHVRNHLDADGIIQSELDELADTTQYVAQFGIEEQGWVRIFHKATGGQNIVTSSRVGSQFYMHSTSMGKVILAHRSREQVEEILDKRGLPECTPHTTTDRDELLDELDQVRKRGYAIDNEENVVGIRCVSAPVRRNDDVFGAVSVSGPASNLSEDQIRDELVAKVEQTTNIIELNLRYS